MWPCSCYIQYYTTKCNKICGHVHVIYNITQQSQNPIEKSQKEARSIPLSMEKSIFVEYYLRLRSEFFFRTIQELEYYFFLSREAGIFFPQSNIRLNDKNSESDYFFFHPPKSEYFFQQHWESEYIFQKKTIPPSPLLQDKWSFPKMNVVLLCNADQ